MNLKECKCGNDLLIQMIPQRTRINDFRVWKPGETCIPESKSVPLFLCPACGRWNLPATSLSGKNRLDAEYQVYEKTIKIMQEHNKRIDEQASSVPVKASDLEAKCKELEELVKGFKQDLETLKKELESNVQAGSGSRKTTKSTSQRSKSTSKSSKDNKE